MHGPNPRHRMDCASGAGVVLTGCDHCGAPAEVVPWPERSSLRVPYGPERTHCVRGHWILRLDVSSAGT